MKTKLLSSQKGLTLVELLLGLAIMGIVSSMIISNLIGGMNSFKSVNKQISLHDEANYIMSTYVNKIFVAGKVTEISGTDTGCGPQLELTDYYGAKIKIGLSGDKALMGDVPLNSDSLIIVCSESKMTLDTVNHTVLIKMVIMDDANKKKLELNNSVSFEEVQ